MALAVFSKNDAALAALCEHGGVERLVGILKEAAAEAGDGGDDGAEEEEEEVLETERALLRELIHSDASLPSLANPRVIQMLLDIVGCQEQNEKLAGVGCNLLAVAISNPGCFDVLCSLEGSKEEVVNRFVRTIVMFYTYTHTHTHTHTHTYIYIYTGCSPASVSSRGCSRHCACLC